MATITTGVTYGKYYRIEVEVEHTTLSVEQVQILTGLVFAKYPSESCYSHERIMQYTLKGNVMTHVTEREQFVWEGDVVNYTWLEVDPNTNGVADTENEYYPTHKYQVKRAGGFVILTCDTEHTTVTFKDGMLESMGDEAAIKIDQDNGLTSRMWFHLSNCYRLANPHLPSDVTYDWHTHHNSDGVIHRAVEDGPAMYQVEGGKYLEGEFFHYVNGVHVDALCQVDPVTGMVKGIPFPVLTLAEVEVSLSANISDMTGVMERVQIVPFTPSQRYIERYNELSEGSI